VIRSDFRFLILTNGVRDRAGIVVPVCHRVFCVRFRVRRLVAVTAFSTLWRRVDECLRHSAVMIRPAVANTDGQSSLPLDLLYHAVNTIKSPANRQQVTSKLNRV
jgi:hypothetical protein